MLPIVMVTRERPTNEKVAAIEAGADDFIAKPVDQPELLARVRSLLRVKQYHDTISRQAAAARPSGIGRSSSASRGRSRRSSGWAGCAASCRRSSPS